MAVECSNARLLVSGGFILLKRQTVGLRGFILLKRQTVGLRGFIQSYPQRFVYICGKLLLFLIYKIEKTNIYVCIKKKSLLSLNYISAVDN